MNVIELFLMHHKRGCPANKGRNCDCRLFEARKEIERLLAIESADPNVQANGPYCTYCGELLSEHLINERGEGGCSNDE
jgi:hypothetical protein